MMDSDYIDPATIRTQACTTCGTTFTPYAWQERMVCESCLSIEAAAYRAEQDRRRALAEKRAS